MGSETMTEMPATPPPVPVKTALILLPVILLLLVGYIAICVVLGLTMAMFAGFLLLFHWAGVRHSAPAQFLPSLFGALAGTGLAWLLAIAPPLGMPLYVVAIALICVALFVDMVRWMPMVINTSFMLFLTIGTALPVAEKGNFPDIFAALLLGAAYFGGIILGLGWLASRRSLAKVEL
jgi:hypothetical protein